MSMYQWPNDDGWPYPDLPGVDLPDPDGDIDDETLSLRAAPPHLFERLEPFERQVIFAHYGLEGSPPLSMKELHHRTGLPRAQLREALATGLAKLRSSLRDQP
jgi:RNA polymerase primary sigma factor